MLNFDPTWNNFKKSLLFFLQRPICFYLNSLFTHSYFSLHAELQISDHAFNLLTPPIQNSVKKNHSLTLGCELHILENVVGIGKHFLISVFFLFVPWILHLKICVSPFRYLRSFKTLFHLSWVSLSPALSWSFHYYCPQGGRRLTEMYWWFLIIRWGLKNKIEIWVWKHGLFVFFF